MQSVRSLTAETAFRQIMETAWNLNSAFPGHHAHSFTRSVLLMTCVNFFPAENLRPVLPLYWFAPID
jgi:hypothetical protein